MLWITEILVEIWDRRQNKTKITDLWGCATDAQHKNFKFQVHTSIQILHIFEQILLSVKHLQTTFYRHSDFLSVELVYHQNIKINSLFIHRSPLWQYGSWSFQMGGTKLERYLPKNQHTQRNFFNFENWTNGEVSKSAKLPKSNFYGKNYPNLSHYFFLWVCWFLGKYFF